MRSPGYVEHWNQGRILNLCLAFSVHKNTAAMAHQQRGGRRAGLGYYGLPPLTALTTALESTGISRHDAGPGLVTYLTSLLERPPNETARNVISILQTILIPTFHLAPSAATDSGYDDPSATARGSQSYPTTCSTAALYAQ